EVALIPPVSGGNPENLFKITEDSIVAQDVIDPIQSDNAGAVITFLGTVRNNTHGRVTSYLEYEAYAPMAEKKMAEVAGDVREKWGIERVAIIHRIGKLEIGEVSVAVGVASPHRKDGFEACKYAMDRLKQIVPIWKREVWADGEEEWVKPDPVYFNAEAQ
ncbi:MAG: molybdenum cofactor biosynthesis protein MoaE, partial [Candidatus Poribacteria bacterium]|nr:molybdenum cofactor biosynthesis protein MoaE [Candidatus Poribacteria bacterium]